jgi:hypothetical protein
MWRRLALAGLAAGALAQSPAAAAGHRPHDPSPATEPPPSLEGTWTANFILTMEATPETPDLVVPETEAKKVAAAVGAKVSKVFEATLDPEAPADIAASDGLPIVRGQRRTRAVVLPADGKLPLTAAAREEMAARPKERGLDNPEDRSPGERCLFGLGVPPITDFIFENALQIVLTRDFAVLHTEYGDEVRVIPLGRAHGPRAVAPGLGDSVGHWEGPTLVIETVGLPDSQRSRGLPKYLVPGSATVIERLTPVSDRELLYQFTVVDAKTYAAPWLAEFSWFRSAQPVREHACHEGNYSLANMLAGARYEEAHARAAAASSH